MPDSLRRLKMCVNNLPAKAGELGLDLLLRFRRGGHEWQTWRATVVSHPIHCMLQSGDTVLGSDKLCCFRDPILPILRRIMIAAAMRFPDCDARVRGRVGKREHSTG